MGGGAEQRRQKFIRNGQQQDQSVLEYHRLCSPLDTILNQDLRGFTPGQGSTRPFISPINGGRSRDTSRGRQ